MRASTPVCIYCARNLPDGKEHWFPKWLGRYDGVDTLCDRVCDECNRNLGQSVDQVHSRSGPAAAARYHMRIEGDDTDWEKANPVMYGSQSSEPHTTIEAWTEGEQIRWLLEDIPGSDPIRRRRARQIVVKSDNGEAIAVRIPNRVDAQWVEKALAERGLVGATLTHIVCEPENSARTITSEDFPPWLRAALAPSFPQENEKIWFYGGDGDPVETQGRVFLGMTSGVIRGIAKLAFHYLLRFDGTVTGAEDEFRPLREFIYSGSGSCQSFVDLASRSFVMSPRRGVTPSGVWHALMAESSSDGILRVRVALFQGHPFYGVDPHKVTLGRDPFTRTLRFGHIIRVHDNPVGGSRGMLEKREIVREPESGLWGLKL